MASEVVKAKDLAGRTPEELATFIREKGEELFKLRFQHFTGQLENVARLGQVRREIARAKFIQSARQRTAEKGA